jgi:hypothetical protein
MASRIWLGTLYPRQDGRMMCLVINFELSDNILRAIGKQAFIAKGNIIEGVEAKE